MTFRINQLSLSEQLKFEMLSEEDKEKVRNCKDSSEALSILNEIKEIVRLNVGSYEPKLQVSGSSVKYKTKNLFTEIFDEEDVQDFATLVEMSITMDEDEVVLGELKRKINSMQKDGKQPLQCMVYSTKQNEKVFYNNEKKVTVWAQVIANTVNFNTEYDLSINHMLVNWGMWKYQISMLIQACSFMKQNEKLDEVIRDLYTNYEDDKVRFTVIKRLLHGLNEKNYQCAFSMLKNADFIGADTDRKYFNTLKRKVENANIQEKEALFSAFRGTQGFSGAKRRRIENLFTERNDSEIARKINESTSEQKDEILRMVHGKVYGSQKEYREIANQAQNIKQYRREIQQMFMDKLEKTQVSIDDIKTYCLAIGMLDTDGRGIAYIEEQMSLNINEDKNIMFLYVLAILADQYIDKFIDSVLAYEGRNLLLNSVRNLTKQGKNQVVRQSLFSNCLKIRETKGIDSREIKNALRNLGDFLHGGHSAGIYDTKFDQLLFEFLGYKKSEGTFETSNCTAKNTALVLGILENIMDKNNYEGRYMKFMWDLFAYFRDKDINMADRVEGTVKHLTGQGIPSM